MTTRELLIREINHAPEDVLKGMLRYLRSELKRQKGYQHPATEQTTGPYAEYWNQFIGAFADEEWDRPVRGMLEQREAW